MILAVMTHDPPPPAQLESELPVALSQLIVRLFAKKPDKRPHSAEAVVAELREIEASLMQQPVLIQVLPIPKPAA